MRRGPQVESISLTSEESARLLEWTRRHKTSQALALRARIVLACQRAYRWRGCAGVAHHTGDCGQVAPTLSERSA
jgi:hypothetical protein